MNAKISTIYLVSVLFLVSSCTIQKRMHLDGFYVSKKNSFSKNRLADNVAIDEEKSEGLNNFHSLPIKNSEIFCENESELEINDSAKTVHLETELYISETNDDELSYCDTIILKSGEIIFANVTEVGKSDIVYKKCENSIGPNYTISKNQVSSIKYVNGSEDNFSPTNSNGNDSNTFENSDGKEYNLLAILGFIFCFIIPPAGFFVSLIAFRQIKAEPDRYAGKGFAIAGMIIGGLYLLAMIGGIVAAIIYLIYYF